MNCPLYEIPCWERCVPCSCVCQTCGGEGRVDVMPEGTNDPQRVVDGPCPDCRGGAA